MTEQEADQLRPHVQIVVEESARKDQRIEELETAITRYRRVAEQHAAGDVSYDLLSKARRQLFAVIRGGM